MDDPGSARTAGALCAGCPSGSTAIAMQNLARIDIDVVNGPTLLSIPV
jgi:hypothetical protein